MKRETTLSADQFDPVLVCLRDRILSISEKIKIAFGMDLALCSKATM
jgi:hypothetical protein